MLKNDMKGSYQKNVCTNLLLWKQNGTIEWMKAQSLRELEIA